MTAIELQKRTGIQIKAIRRIIGGGQKEELAGHNRVEAEAVVLLSLRLLHQGFGFEVLVGACFAKTLVHLAQAMEIFPGA